MKLEYLDELDRAREAARLYKTQGYGKQKKGEKDPFETYYGKDLLSPATYFTEGTEMPEDSKFLARLISTIFNLTSKSPSGLKVEKGGKRKYRPRDPVSEADWIVEQTLSGE